MPIPKTALKRGLELSEGASIFGVQFSELTREELIAVAALGWFKKAKESEDKLNRWRNAKRCAEM